MMKKKRWEQWTRILYQQYPIAMLFGNSTTEMILKYSSWTMKNHKEYHEFSWLLMNNEESKRISWIFMHRFSKNFIPSDGCVWEKTLASTLHGAVGFFKTTGPPETEASSPMPAEVGSQVRVERCFVFFLSERQSTTLVNKKNTWKKPDPNILTWWWNPNPDFELAPFKWKSYS